MVIKVLVVCLGNICRSPMGEVVLKDVAAQRHIDLVVDSCGTAGYHIGEDPDPRTVATCKEHGIPIDHKARQIRDDDFTRFTHILAADGSVLRHLNRIKPAGSTATVRLWGSYDSNGKPIPDPYYGGMDGFENVYQQCVALSHVFLDAVVES